MAPQERYVIDANALIGLYRYFGSKAVRKLREMLKDKSLRSPEGVVRELLRGTDRIARFVKNHRSDLEISFKENPKLIFYLSKIETRYGEFIHIGRQKHPGLWSSPAGRRSADAQVVAAAIALQATVVSDDHTVQLVCSLEGVPCIGWAEFARRIGLVPQSRLPSL